MAHVHGFKIDFSCARLASGPQHARRGCGKPLRCGVTGDMPEKTKV